MQLNKILQNLVFALQISIVTACNLHKNNINDQINGINTENSYSKVMNGNNVPYNEQVRLKIQQLQQNNIIYFNLDKYEILPDFDQVLDLHATFLLNHPFYKITLEGHADERGTPEYNIALGERRANAVKMYMQGKGVFSNQISIVSYGKEKPAVLGHNEAAYSRNRRVVLVY